jgi:hypothetical protein
MKYKIILLVLIFFMSESETLSDDTPHDIQRYLEGVENRI